MSGRGRIDKARWQLASPLLDQLLDADIAERAAQLARIRRTDRRLAAELEALLVESKAARREAFLERSLLRTEAGAEGARVGGYVLESPIGRGGMGSVWLARRHGDGMPARVAVKFLHLALLRHRGGERFRREGEMLARLAHPNIARLIDAGVAQGGQPYLVLEHVEGLPIDEWCDSRSLSAAARIRLFIDVLAAVSHAHARLVLHCDLKPSNIFVTHEGVVKLLDFGVSRRLGEASPAQSSRPKTSVVLSAFTPRFAAPEQIESQETTTATDVYALGGLLRLLLADRPELQHIVVKALRPSPAERYATPAEMARDLQACLDRQDGARSL